MMATESAKHTGRGPRLSPPLGLLVVAGLCCSSPLAWAQDDTDDEISVGLDPSLGLDPSNPQVGSMPGGMTPAYGQGSSDTEDWRFDFHGFLRAPMRFGINTRKDPGPNQSKTVYHAPPVVPDDLETFSHTGVVPTPYGQLNFSYGNNVVTGTAVILARQTNVSSGFFDPPSQAGVNDLFMTLTPDVGSRLKLQANVGAFSNRYGTMGEYDEGQYDTPLIARINGVGETISVTAGFGQWAVTAEQGIQGQSSKAPSTITPEGWNDFADDNVGSSFVNHIHAGVSYAGKATLGLHYVTAFSQDDRATGTNLADGRIDILGADLRLTLGRFGHLFLAGAHTNADRSRTVGRVVEVLNTKGGPGLMDNYLGPDSKGTGKLLTLGAQYDLSIGKLISYPVPFYGDGPDVVVSLFGLQTQVQSDDANYDGITKRKFGGEVGYGQWSWLAFGLRYDQVTPNTDDGHFSFAVVSPRIIFRTDWNSQDQVVLQYSRWLNGTLTTVRTGYPPREDPSTVPDEHMISLSGSMWW